MSYEVNTHTCNFLFVPCCVTCSCLPHIYYVLIMTMIAEVVPKNESVKTPLEICIMVTQL